MLSITAIYAGLLGLLLVVLSFGVIRERLRHQVSLGDGGNADLQTASRRQGNFVEYVPLALLLIAIAEVNGAPSGLVHGLGATLVVGRVLHPLGLAAEFGVRVPRLVGTVATFGVIIVASVVDLMSVL